MTRLCPSFKGCALLPFLFLYCACFMGSYCVGQSHRFLLTSWGSSHVSFPYYFSIGHSEHHSVHLSIVNSSQCDLWGKSGKISLYLFIASFFFFFGQHLCHMEVPKSDLQLLVYATAIATRDPSHVCDLHHSSQQRWILNPLSGARIKPASSWILVKFVTAEPQQELPKWVFRMMILL